MSWKAITPAGSTERAVHGVVSRHALVGVVAVDHQEVDPASAEDRLELPPGLGIVRVAPQEMQRLSRPRVRSEAGGVLLAVAAAVRPAREVDGDEQRFGLGQRAPRGEGPAARGPDLHDGLKTPTLSRRTSGVSSLSF